jgi:NAD(P)H-hydrate epimerase
VLLGLVAGLLAQGLGAREGAALAAFVHGAAADAYTRRVGASGLLAAELAAQIPETLAALRGEPSPDGVDDRLVVAFPEP